MPLPKPYFRIYRPGSSGYERDPRYADDRISLCRGFALIESDLKRIFEYVEPADNNLQTYSHRIYELFLRACTEFEANCKGILDANEYRKSSNYNIEDYCKLETSSRLSDYKTVLYIWKSRCKTFEPFREWKSSRTLSWYQAYNTVKHNRETHFNYASLENLLNSIAGLFCVLYSQFSNDAFFKYTDTGSFYSDEEGYCFVDDSVFGIKWPDTWTSDERYAFNWNTLSKDTSPFEQYNFT
ncbi:MAG: hypothetical protein AB1510_03930 [Bacillota bacterium]